jgi:hypothetical protein
LRRLGTRIHDGLDDFNNLLGDLSELGARQRFFELGSDGPIGHSLGYPHEDPLTPITANRTADIDSTLSPSDMCGGAVVVYKLPLASFPQEGV